MIPWWCVFIRMFTHTHIHVDIRQWNIYPAKCTHSCTMHSNISYFPCIAATPTQRQYMYFLNDQALIDITNILYFKNFKTKKKPLMSIVFLVLSLLDRFLFQYKLLY